MRLEGGRSTHADHLHDKPTDNPADPFKKALAEATKVMADDPDMTVTYSVDPPGMTKDGVRLPQVSRRMTRDEVLLARGTADAFALRRKFHDEATVARYAPTGQMAREIYDAMETARCEAVGARAMPGTAGNIDAKIGHEADRKGYAQITQACRRAACRRRRAIWCAIWRPGATCRRARPT